jgi:hypothetical protein
VRSQTELEDLWRDRLNAARCSYELAALEAEKALVEREHKAIRSAETQALSEYLRVLKVFTGLVLDGKIPKEPEAVNTVRTLTPSSR